MTDAQNLLRNAIDPGVIKAFFDEARGYIDEREKLKAEFREYDQDLRDKLKDVRNNAKDAGIPRKVFNAALKRLGLLQELGDVTAELDTDDRDVFGYIIGALEDTAPQATTDRT